MPIRVWRFITLVTATPAHWTLLARHFRIGGNPGRKQLSANSCLLCMPPIDAPSDPIPCERLRISNNLAITEKPGSCHAIPTESDDSRKGRMRPLAEGGTEADEHTI
jgi:hypothetical protein